MNTNIEHGSRRTLIIYRSFSWEIKCFLMFFFIDRKILLWLCMILWRWKSNIFIKINDEETILLKRLTSNFASNMPQGRQLVCDHRLSLWSYLSLHLVLKDSRASQNHHFGLVITKTRLMKFNLLNLIILLSCKAMAHSSNSSSLHI